MATVAAGLGPAPQPSWRISLVLRHLPCWRVGFPAVPGDDVLNEVVLPPDSSSPGTGRPGSGHPRRGTLARPPRVEGRRPRTPHGSRTPCGPGRLAGAPPPAASVLSMSGSRTPPRPSGPDWWSGQTANDLRLRWSPVDVGDPPVADHQLRHLSVPRGPARRSPRTVCVGPTGGAGREAHIGAAPSRLEAVGIPAATYRTGSLRM
jgi:hypothetical protein